MKKNLCLNLLSGDSFLQINTSLIHFFDGDLDSLIVLSLLISQYKYLSELNQIDAQDYFYSTVEFIESRVHLSEYRQREAIKKLENKFGLIKTKKKGLPAKRFIWIDFDKIVGILSKEETKPKYEVKDKGTFYTKLNEGVQKGWDEYRTTIDRIEKNTALGMYFWSKLYKKKYKKDWVWDSEQFGIMHVWIKTKKRTGEIDFSCIEDYLQNVMALSDLELSGAIILKKFFTWEKGRLPLAPSLRLTDPVMILEKTKE